MSRYQLLSDVPGTKVFVGWNASLQTFFAQVLGHSETPDGEPAVHLSIGTAPRACVDVDDLANQISPWAKMPLGIAIDLARERDNTAPAHLPCDRPDRC